MATVTDVEVANQSFPNVRQDLNDILEALATNFSADAEPTTTYPNQFWYETDTNLLYIRNEANDAWVTLASINQTSGEWEPRTAVIQAIDSAGLALKTDEGTTRFSISDAGVVSFENYSFPSADGTDGQVLTTDGAGNLTFESGGGGDIIQEGNSSVEVVDTGTGHVKVTVDGSETARFDANGRLGIGTSSPSNFLINVSRGSGMGTEPTWEPTSARNIALFETDNSEGYVVIGAPANGFSALSFADAGSKSAAYLAYSHSDNSMRFRANDAERMRIHSGGEITSGSQPAFLALNGGGDSISNATTATISFGAEKFDQGGDFDSSTTFTAPVTGKYLFNWSVRVDAGGSSNTRFGEASAYLVTSNRSYYIKPGSLYSDADDRFEISACVLADMDANDTARIDVFFSRAGASGGTTTVGGTTDPITHFSGHLVC